MSNANGGKKEMKATKRFGWRYRTCIFVGGLIYRIASQAKGTENLPMVMINTSKNPIQTDW
jgi:hypothetical protein